MLIRFGCSNYRSIADYQEILFTSSSNKVDDDVLTIETNAFKEKILPICAIYGANAAGKTNFIRALRCMHSAIVHSYRKEYDFPFSTFKLDDGISESESIFDIDFICDGVHYHYGYSIEKSNVISEWLYSFSYGARSSRKVLFYRDANNEQEFHFSKELPGKNKTIVEIMDSKSLFLSVAAQLKHPVLSLIREYFSNNFHFRFEQNINEDSIGEMIIERNIKDELSRLLSIIDPSVVSIDVSKEEIDEKHRMFLDSITKTVQDLIGNENLPMPRKEYSFHIKLNRKRPNGDTFEFSFDEESLGTKSLISILTPIIYVLRHGGIIVIDEIESSLHSLLSRKVVELFNCKDINKNNAQVFFTTHETQLLNFSGICKDEVWFTEKNDIGSTVLWPLSDFKIDKRSNLRNGYLEGRFGGIPLLGALEKFKLFEE